MGWEWVDQNLLWRGPKFLRRGKTERTWITTTVGLVKGERTQTFTWKGRETIEQRWRSWKRNVSVSVVKLAELLYRAKTQGGCQSVLTARWTWKRERIWSGVETVQKYRAGNWKHRVVRDAMFYWHWGNGGLRWRTEKEIWRRFVSKIFDF